MQIQPTSIWYSSSKEKFILNDKNLTITANKGTAEVSIGKHGEIIVKGGKNVSVSSDILNKENTQIIMNDSEISSIYTGYGKDIIMLNNCQFKDKLLDKTNITLRGSNNELYVKGDLKGRVNAQQDPMFDKKEKADKIFISGTNYADIQVDPDDNVKAKKK